MEGAVGAGRVMVRSGCRVSVPAAFVHQVMMPGAQGEQVGQVGGAVVVPVDDVVDLAVSEPHGAAGMAAGAVHRP